MMMMMMMKDRRRKKDKEDDEKDLAEEIDEMRTPSRSLSLELSALRRFSTI